MSDYLVAPQRTDAYVKTGRRLFPSDSGDLFDQIINLKMIRADGTTFSIRSDYEPVFGKKNTVSFRKCLQKPSIKITYRQAAQAVAIEVNIEVTNLFIDKSNGDPYLAKGARATGDRSTQGNPVVSCIVQLGYFSQFPDWSDPSVVKTCGGVDGFYELQGLSPIAHPGAGRYAQMSVQVLDSYPKNHPPDEIILYKGIIGSVQPGVRPTAGVDELFRSLGTDAELASMPWLFKELFTWITRRYVRAAFPWRPDEDGFKWYENEKWHKEQYAADGLLPIMFAKDHGVLCILSKRLREMPNTAPPRYNGSPPSPISERGISDDQQDFIGAQFRALQETYSWLRWMPMPDGNFYVYHVGENTETTLLEARTNVRMRRGFLLPAVYDITWAGTRTITCPFYTLIYPMSVVFFNSRYHIGTRVGFFYQPRAGKYLVISAEVEFETAGDTNLTTLKCVDYSPDDPPHLQDDGTIDWGEAAEQAAEETRRDIVRWHRMELTVVQQRGTVADPVRTTPSRFLNVINNKLLPSIGAAERELWTKVSGWPEDTAGQNRRLYAQAYEALAEWNPNFFQNPSRFGSREGTEWNRLSGGEVKTDEVPWIYEGEKIAIRLPWLPSYDPAGEVTDE